MRLKELRENMNMTQADVIIKSKELGGKFTQQQLSRWENGAFPSEKNIEILAKIFDVKKEELFDNTGENKTVEFYNKGYLYGTVLAENGLTFNQFVTHQKKHSIPEFGDKGFEEAKKSMIDFFIELSTGVAAPISKEFLEVTNIKEIYNFYIGMYNAILSKED